MLGCCCWCLTRPHCYIAYCHLWTVFSELKSSCVETDYKFSTNECIAPMGRDHILQLPTLAVNLYIIWPLHRCPVTVSRIGRSDYNSIRYTCCTDKSIFSDRRLIKRTIRLNSMCVMSIRIRASCRRHGFTNLCEEIAVADIIEFIYAIAHYTVACSRTN